MSTDASDVTFAMEVTAVDGDQSSGGSGMQAWLRLQLDDYVKWNLLEPNEELDWENGRVLLCLVHRFFPDRVPDLPDLLLLPPNNREDDGSRSNDATAILLEELDVPVPSPPYHNSSLMDYLDDVRKRAIAAFARSDSIPITTTTGAINTTTITTTTTPTTTTTTTTTTITTSARQVPLISETVVQLSAIELQNDGDGEFERRAGLVMTRMSHLRGKLWDMVGPDAANMANHEDEDLITQVEQFETGLAAFVTQDWAAYEAYIQDIPAAKKTTAVSARLQEIDAAYAALESLALQNEFKAIRARAKFSQLTLPLRNELEFIEAKMVKAGTETDVSNLEERSRAAGELFWCIEHEYGKLMLRADDNDDDDGESRAEHRHQQTQVELLKQHYILTRTWVCQARIWFNKATMARQWIQERINRIESQPLQDGLQPLDLAAASTAFPAVIQLREAHQEIEREVTQFNQEDAACLRSHIQALLEPEKELCPADRVAIEIIPGTLMLLDRLVFLLRQQSYRIQVITFRIAWDQACVKADRWIADTKEQVSALIKEALWEFDEERRIGRAEADMRNDGFSKRFAAIEQKISEFDRGQFGTTSNAYQDLSDLSRSELPAHLRARQLALEKDFRALAEMVDYFERVVEQRRVVTDFVYGANALLADGTALTHDMRMAELRAAVAKGDSGRWFAERVSLFQHQSVQLLTGVVSRIGYPEHPHRPKEETTNAMVGRVIAGLKSSLALLGDTLDASLAAYQRGLKLQKIAAQLSRDLNQLDRSVQKQLSDISLTKVDVLIERIALDESDVRCLQAECDNRMAKIASIKNGEEKTLMDAVEALKRDIAAAAAGGKEAHVELAPVIAALEEDMVSVQNSLVRLEARVGLQQSEVNGLRKRLDWERHYYQVSNTVSSGIQNVWTWIDRIQWRPGTPIAIPQPNTMKQEMLTLQQTADGLHRLGQECDTVFAEMVKEFDVLFSGKDTPVPAHFQRRQARLHVGLEELSESLAFAHMVLEQHTAIAAYMEKASVSRASGAHLLARIDEALHKVMDNRTSTSFTIAVECYGSDIAEVWRHYGQRIGYPCRTTGISTARLSTHDDAINIKIKMAVSSQQDELYYLHDRMQFYNGLYITSLQSKVRILRYMIEADEQTRRMIKVTEAIANDRQILETDRLDLETCADPSTLTERNKTYAAELNRCQAAWESLGLRCIDLTEAIHRSGCAPYVQTTMADEAMMKLKDQMNNTSNVSTQHTRELDVYCSRVDWERHIQGIMATATSIQGKLEQTLGGQQRRGMCSSSDGVDHNQLILWRDERDQTKQLMNELSIQTSSMADPSFERMRARWCALSDAVPPAIVNRHKGLHNLLEKLQLLLVLVSEHIRASEFAEAYAGALQQTLKVQNMIENTDTKDLCDNFIGMWHDQIKSLSLEPPQSSARTDEERAKYEKLVKNHQALVESLENAETRLSNRRLAESYESRALALVQFFRDMSKSLQATQAKLNTITGVAADDQFVCESCTNDHAEINRALQQRTIEYSEVCVLFDMLQQRNVSTSEHSLQHTELIETEAQTHQTLTSTYDAIVWAIQWKDLHANLYAMENELDMMVGKVREATLISVNTRYTDTRVSAEKLSRDSGQQGNANAFQQHYEKLEAAAAAVRKQVELRRIEEKAQEETSRIHQQVNATASHYSEKGTMDGDDLVVQLEQDYDAHTASLSERKSEADDVLAEKLRCLSIQSENLEYNQQQLIFNAQEALDSLLAARDDEARLAALLQQIIPLCKEAHRLLGQIDSCKADIHDTALTTWDEKTNLAELEDKVLQLKAYMTKFKTTSEGLLQGSPDSCDIDAVDCLKKHVIATNAHKVEEAWESLWNAFMGLKDKAYRREGVLSHMQEVLKLCSETHERVGNLESGLIQMVGSSPSRSLPHLLREKDILVLEQELGMIETAFGDHVTMEVQKLDDQLAELEDDRTFTEQRIDIDDAIANLFGLMEGHRERLASVLDVGRCLGMADDIELLLAGLQEAVAKVDNPSRLLQQSHGGASAVEQDPRSRHYKQKIVRSLKAAQVAAGDIADTTHRQLVLGHLAELDQRWQQQRGLTTTEPADLEARTRKSSLPTRRSAPSRLPVVVAAPSVQSNTSSPLVSLGRLLPSSSSSSQRASRLQQRRMIAPSLRRTPSKSASNAETAMAIGPRPPPPPVNNYVADPKNDLDIEISRIVNMITYKVTVKRVPGESGRYWFGDTTPKIAFCRVLKSKMVMVRVGGGWMELTEFLRNHALFDGDYSVPKPASNPDKPDLRFQECFIETRKHRIRERSLPGSV